MALVNSRFRLQEKGDSSRVCVRLPYLLPGGTEKWSLQAEPGKRARDDYLWASILNSRTMFQAASSARARIRNEAIVLGALCYETKNSSRGMMFLELGGGDLR